MGFYITLKSSVYKKKSGNKVVKIGGFNRLSSKMRPNFWVHVSLALLVSRR